MCRRTRITDLEKVYIFSSYVYMQTRVVLIGTYCGLSEPQCYITISYLYTDGNSIPAQYVCIIYVVVNQQGVPAVCVMMVGLSQRFNIYSANTFDTFIYIKKVSFYFL